MITSTTDYEAIYPVAQKFLEEARNSDEGARTGEIPTIKIGRRILVPIAALNHKLDHPDHVA